MKWPWTYARISCVAPLQAPPDDLRHRSSEDQPITLEWFAVLVVLEMDSGRSFSECENQRNDVVDFCRCFFEDCCSCNDFIVVFHITGITKIPCSVLVSCGSGVPPASSFTCLWFLKLSMWKPGAAKPNSWRVQTDNREDDLDKLWQFPSNQSHKWRMRLFHNNTSVYLFRASHVKSHLTHQHPMCINIRSPTDYKIWPSTSSSLPSCCPKPRPIWPMLHRLDDQKDMFVLREKMRQKKWQQKSHWKRRTKNCLHFELHHDFQVWSEFPSPGIHSYVPYYSFSDVFRAS